MTNEDSATAKAISRALGEEIRRIREELGLSRKQFVIGLSICERTLLAYEHGLRLLTVFRFTQLCVHLDTDAVSTYGLALQRAGLYLTNLTLQVDLNKVISASNTRFRPIVPWARNRLRDTPNGVVDLAPVAIRELAAFIGQPHEDLAQHLSKFSPDLSTTQEAA